ncbi:MAG: phenylalanyl-tRNA synthetase alpha subunit [Desulforhopalus sp.]|jgi:phenylalanyl-tRNA synthetase alpha subunit
MGTSNNLSNDMETLQREVEELKEYKRQKELEKKQERVHSEEIDATSDGESKSEVADISENEIQNISDQLETFLQNVGTIELERPALTLVAVFTLGAVVGHLLSRR